MADFTNAKNALENDIGEGLVEEYQISNTGRRVKRGALSEQVKALAMLGGLIDRSTNGVLRVGKLQEPSD